MKLKNLKIFSILVFCLCCIFATNVYAASVKLSGNSSGNPSSKVTITVSGDFTGRVNLTASNGTLSTSSVWIESNSQSVTVTLGSSGTTTVTATPQEGTSTPTGEFVTVAASSKTISIKQPTTGNNTNNKPTTTPSNNTGTTTNKPTNTNTNTNKPTNTNTNTNKNTSSKSSNANLKSMILNVEGLSPAFAKNITTYSLKVGENVNEIKVNASVEHSRASFSVTGNTNLKDGENVVKVKVTAEDGTVKTYTINVLKSDDPIKSDATLESLIIEDVDLGQTFDSNITEYDAGDITVKADKLNIYAYTTSDNAKVEIIGNENLKQGENKITIKVTSENGKVSKEYIVKFNKLYSEDVEKVDRDALKDTEKGGSSFTNSIKTFYNNTLKPNMTVLILYFFIWVEFIQVVYLYQRLKKYEDLDKITVSRKLKNLYVKEVNQPSRRKKENPVFPDEEEKND